MKTVQRSKPARQACIDLLLERHNPDGGWGAREGATSNTECTALACLALRATPADRPDAASPLRAGERWLLGSQQTSGAWSYGDAGAAATWPTPLALLALLPHESAPATVTRGYEWLLELRGKSLPWRQRLREFLAGKQTIELDSTLDGWPWTPGTFSWVEPTAWALVALKARWPGRAPRRVRKRIRIGEKMLADRECPAGGWNYGNSRVMGQDLDPYPDTTALALLGLRGGDTDLAARGFRVLDRLLDRHASGLSLALAHLSHRAWGRPGTQLSERLRAYQVTDAIAADHRTLALATLATAPHVDWLGVGADD